MEVPVQQGKYTHGRICTFQSFPYAKQPNIKSTEEGSTDIFRVMANLSSRVIKEELDFCWSMDFRGILNVKFKHLSHLNFSMNGVLVQKMCFMLKRMHLIFTTTY